MSKKKELSNSKDTKIIDPFRPDKRYTRKYEKQLIEYVNRNISPEEQGVYKAIAQALIEDNKLDKAQDLLMLDIMIFDFLRIKRVQNLIREHGDANIITGKKGTQYVKVNDANHLLNSITTQFRNYMKDMGLSRGERIKTKLGIETQDFASFMSEAIEVEAEIEEDGKKQ